MNVSMNLDFNKHVLDAELKQRYERGIMVATSELRRYSNQYVRVLTGKMKDSSYYASDLKKGLLVYDTPYAEYAYRNTKNHVTKDLNVNARPMWVDFAIQQHLKAIERTVQKEMEK